MPLKQLCFILFTLALTACETAPQKDTEKKAAAGNTNGTATAETEDGNSSQQATEEGSGNWEKLVMIPLRDNRGTLLAQMPFPSTWRMIAAKQGEPSIVGPNGVKVIDYPIQSFMYTNDPQLQQIYYQSGQRLRAMPGVEQVIKQDIEPWCANRGLQYVKHYEVPEVTRVDKWYNDQLYKAVPTQTEVAAVGTEWKAADGSPFFLLLHFFVGNSSNLQTWYYMANSLEAEPEHFEKARKQYIFSLSNIHYELEPIMAYNQSEAEKAGRSWAAHNQRMAQNQANFEASQRAFVNKSNAVNDAIMSGWRERNAASDRSHEMFVDAITERTKVADPTTGQQYKVSSGYNNYWMNSNGEYISTDQHNYNPNLDENMNNQNWQKLKEVPY